MDHSRTSGSPACNSRPRLPPPEPPARSRIQRTSFARPLVWPAINLLTAHGRSRAKTSLGSPTTYGPFLATYLARESLKSADPVQFREPIDRSGRWLAVHETKSLMDVSVALLVSAADCSPSCLRVPSTLLRQTAQGTVRRRGLGAVCRIASGELRHGAGLDRTGQAGSPAETRDLITRGRGFLIAHQQPDGSWIETTRPPGAESYAQRVSTSAWAALALIATRDGSPGERSDLKP